MQILKLNNFLEISLLFFCNHHSSLFSIKSNISSVQKLLKGYLKTSGFYFLLFVPKEKHFFLQIKKKEKIDDNNGWALTNFSSILLWKEFFWHVMSTSFPHMLALTLYWLAQMFLFFSARVHKWEWRKPFDCHWKFVSWRVNLFFYFHSLKMYFYLRRKV
jgi:hypothetical protein